MFLNAASIGRQGIISGNMFRPGNATLEDLLRELKAERLSRKGRCSDDGGGGGGDVNLFEMRGKLSH